MGLGILSNCSNDTPTSLPKPSKTGNPNKFRFKLLSVTTYYFKYTIVFVKYDDCFNYEGKKILVYDDPEKLKEMIAKREIDPHFLENELSPIARFEPTSEGFEMAEMFINALHNKENEK